MWAGGARVLGLWKGPVVSTFNTKKKYKYVLLNKKLFLSSTSKCNIF